MMVDDWGKACVGFRKNLEPAVAFEAAPVIAFGYGQNDIAQSELGFGEVATDEVGIGGGEVFLSEALAGEEEAGAAVEEESGGFVEGDAGGIAMVVAAVEESVVADDPAMAHEQVIVEHADGAAAEAGEGEDLELDIDADGGGEGFAEVMECGFETAVVEECAAANEDEELEIVVGTVVAVFTKDAAFTTAVATGEDEAFELVAGDEAFNAGADVGAGESEVLLQAVAAVDGETCTHAERESRRYCST
jgi:hypothetical protein